MTTITIVMISTRVKMYLSNYCLILIILKILQCNALNCRSDGNPKENVLKEIYTKCKKIQDEQNSNTSKAYNDQDWRDRRGHNHYERGKSKDSGDRNERESNDRDNSRDGNERGNRNRKTMNDRTDVRNDRYNNRDYGTSRKDMMNNFNDGYDRDDHISARMGFQNDEFESNVYNRYYPSNQLSQRYKRENRNENSGQRSQYNPNTQKNANHEGFSRSDEKNSSENNSSNQDEGKDCALQCFMEKLEMTDSDGKPDKHKVLHSITKDAKNEDLKDFLQEAVDECFQMLENENTNEKCEFSKNLLMCLSEKGRANCDDWKDDLRF